MVTARTSRRISPRATVSPRLCARDAAGAAAQTSSAASAAAIFVSLLLIAPPRAALRLTPGSAIIASRPVETYPGRAPARRAQGPGLCKTSCEGKYSVAGRLLFDAPFGENSSAGGEALAKNAQGNRLTSG